MLIFQHQKQVSDNGIQCLENDELGLEQTRYMQVCVHIYLNINT